MGDSNYYVGEINSSVGDNKYYIGGNKKEIETPTQDKISPT